MTKKQQRVGKRKPARKNREQTSARVAQAAGRLLRLSYDDSLAIDWLELVAGDTERQIAPHRDFALRILRMLRDGMTVAGSALTQTPTRKKAR